MTTTATAAAGAAAASTTANEISHYVVTAHPPGAVLATAECNFVAHDSVDVLIAKSGRLELRQVRSSASSAGDTTMGGGSGSGSGALVMTSSHATTTTTTTTSNSTTTPFPLLWQVPVHGRITHLIPIPFPHSPTSLVFFLTDRHQYGVLGYAPSATTNSGGSNSSSGVFGNSAAATLTYPVVTHASGSLYGHNTTLGLMSVGRESDAGPLVVHDPHNRCLAIHIQTGLIVVIPIHAHYKPNSLGAGRAKHDGSGWEPTTSSHRSSSSSSSCLGTPFTCRVEERTILGMTFLHVTPPATGMPHLSLLYQDARGVQHLTTHLVNMSKRQLHFYSSSSAASAVVDPSALSTAGAEWIRKTSVDGGSAILIAVPPLQKVAPAPAAAAAAASTAPSNNTSPVGANLSGGVIIIGQRQFSYVSTTTTKLIPVPQALYLTYCALPADPQGQPRFLIGDEFGNLHLLTLLLQEIRKTPQQQQQPQQQLVIGLQMETLGSCTLSNCLAYLGQGLCYVASTLGDSQLIQIHDQPIPLESGMLVDEGSSHHPEEPVVEDPDLMDTTYIQVLEEYTNLGPILDFDLIPTNPQDGSSGGGSSEQQGPSSSATLSVQQSQVVTASGTSKMGSLRLIRNGIGMNEYASVEIPGISNMWSLAATFAASRQHTHTYLVQSFVGETRVLGVTTSGNGADAGDEVMHDDNEDEDDDIVGSLEEVVLAGLDSYSSTLYVGNVPHETFDDVILQVTERELRLFRLSQGNILCVVGCPGNEAWTVAAANAAGQIVTAQRGGRLMYYQIQNGQIELRTSGQMEREVSCLNINPFRRSDGAGPNTGKTMDSDEQSSLATSQYVAVGLWDDFTVRLLKLEADLPQLHKISLNSNADGGGGDDDAMDETGDDTALTSRRNRNHMMARSLCLITLDFNSSTSNNLGSSPSGVDMLFVGLGDGTLVSFAVITTPENVVVGSRKEVCLGTQRIDLVPLSTSTGNHNCVLATGDRPTVIYLAGIGGGSSNPTSAGHSTHFNPKLCYSTVNLSAPNEEDERGMLDDNVTRPPSQQSIAVHVAAPFSSPYLLDTAANATAQQYSLCVADESSLRLGVIDDIQKLHVTTCRLGMAPRRIVHCCEARLFAVGCVESGIKTPFGSAAPEATTMGNCIRFMDDTTFDDLQRIDMEPFEAILSMSYVFLKVPADSGTRTTTDRPTFSHQPYLLVGTGYALADEAEITRGRILVYSCDADGATNQRTIRPITEMSTTGGVFSICSFYNGTALCSVNSKTMVLQLTTDTGLPKLQYVGQGHHGHILSNFVQSLASTSAPEAKTSNTATTTMEPAMSVHGQSSEKKEEKPVEDQLAIVGDLMRSISLVQFYPEHLTLEEVARDFTSNWTTAVEMLNEDIYLGAEHWCNLYCLRRNKTASSEEVRCRLDAIGEFNLGEMCNKFRRGSLVMPVSSNNSSNASTARRRPRYGTPKKSGTGAEAAKVATPATPAPASARLPVVTIGSQTLFGTVEGSLGVILGLDGRTAAFFTTLERAMAKVIRPIGDLSHQMYRAFQAERKIIPAHGFVDGDLIESFLDLDRKTMEAVVKEMNRDGAWEIDDAVAVRPNTSQPDDRAQSKDDRMTESSSYLSVEDVVAMVEEIAMLH